MKNTTVKLKVWYDDERPNDVFVTISVRSHKRRGIGFLWATRDIDANHPRLEYEVERAAAGLAAHLNLKYKDEHDPKAIGACALEILAELKAKSMGTYRKLTVDLRTGSVSKT